MSVIARSLLNTHFGFLVGWGETTMRGVIVQKDNAKASKKIVTISMVMNHKKSKLY